MSKVKQALSSHVQVKEDSSADSSSGDVTNNKHADKASQIMRILDLYCPPPVPVPLNHGSGFQLLSAICLSAQTTDTAVNNATTELWRRFPTAAATASQATIPALEALLRSIGLYKNKAKNLLGMSQLLVANHGGDVPSGA